MKILLFLIALIVFFTTTDVNAEPISMTGIMILGMYISWSAIIAVGISLAVSAVSMAASMLLAKKPEAGGLTRNAHLINTQATSEPIKVVYGKCRVGGNRVFVHAGGTGYGRLNVAMVWSEGPCEGLDSDGSGNLVYYDDKRMQYYEAFRGSDLSDHVFYQGTGTQVHDTMLSNAIYGNVNWDDAMRWTCYSAFRLVASQDAWNKLPDFTCVLKGRKLYDPRDLSTQWGTGATTQSQNPALVWYDFMTNARYGMGISTSMIDTQSVIDAANWCDVGLESVPYQFNGIIMDRKTFSENIQDILNSFRAYMLWSNGKYYLNIYSYDTACMTLTENDTGTLPDQFQISMPGIPETPNRILVTFADSNDNYVAKEVTIDDTTSITLDGEPRQIEMVLIGCTDYELAVQLGTFHLKRARYNKSFTIPCHPRTVALDPGDMVQLTHTFPGWTAQTLRVQSMGLPMSGLIPITFMEESSTIYDMSGINIATHLTYSTTLPDPHYPVEEVTGLIAATGPDELTANKHDAYIIFQWDIMLSGCSYILRWRYSNASGWNTTTIDIPYGIFEPPVWKTDYPIGYSVKMTGDYEGIYDTQFLIEFDSTSTFKWSADYGDSFQALGVAITGAWQTLQDGLKIKFSNTTGWTSGQYFTIEATGTQSSISFLQGGLRCGEEVYWNVRLVKTNSSDRSDWATSDVSITTWDVQLPSMAGYYPIPTPLKQGKQLKVDWSTWEGYGDRIAKALLVDISSLWVAPYDYTDEANDNTKNDVPLLPASPVVTLPYSDGFVFCSKYPFTKLFISLLTPGIGDWTITWKYQKTNTIWTELNNVIDNTNGFTLGGEKVVSWAYPEDWGTWYGGPAGTNEYYAIWAELTTFTSMTRRPLAKKIRIENITVKDYDVFCSTANLCPIDDPNIVGHNVRLSPFQFPWAAGVHYDVRIRPNGWSGPGIASDSHEIVPGSCDIFQICTRPYTGTLYTDNGVTKIRSSRPRNVES